MLAVEGAANLVSSMLYIEVWHLWIGMLKVIVEYFIILFLRYDETYW
jgi:hypothetical protein